jgi:hypothetical protein
MKTHELWYWVRGEGLRRGSFVFTGSVRESFQENPVTVATKAASFINWNLFSIIWRQLWFKAMTHTLWTFVHRDTTTTQHQQKLHHRKVSSKKPKEGEFRAGGAMWMGEWRWKCIFKRDSFSQISETENCTLSVPANGIYFFLLKKRRARDIA